MDGLNRIFGSFTWFIITYSVAFDLYLAFGSTPPEIDDEVFKNVLMVLTCLDVYSYSDDVFQRINDRG